MCASQQYEDHQTTRPSNHHTQDWIQIYRIGFLIVILAVLPAQGFIILQEVTCISFSATDLRASNEGHRSEVPPCAGTFSINPSSPRTRTNVVLDSWPTTTLERWGSLTDPEHGFWVISFSLVVAFSRRGRTLSLSSTVAPHTAS